MSAEETLPPDPAERKLAGLMKLVEITHGLAALLINRRQAWCVRAEDGAEQRLLQACFALDRRRRGGGLRKAG